MTGSTGPLQSAVTADKLLVTVLFDRTQPLIRYELIDRVRFRPREPWTWIHLAVRPDRRPRGGHPQPARPRRLGVRIHPNLFHTLLESTRRPWQVVLEADRLRIPLADEGRTDGETLTASVRRALTKAGADHLPLSVEHVVAIPRTRMGKSPWIRIG